MFTIVAVCGFRTEQAKEGIIHPYYYEIIYGTGVTYLPREIKWTQLLLYNIQMSRLTRDVDNIILFYVQKCEENALPSDIQIRKLNIGTRIVWNDKTDTSVWFNSVYEKFFVCTSFNVNDFSREFFYRETRDLSVSDVVRIVIVLYLGIVAAYCP